MKVISFEGKSGDFYNSFNDTIMIGEKSKVGLVSCSIKLGDKPIVVNGNNNKMNVKYLAGDTTYQVGTLTSNSYNTTDFMKELTRVLNTTNYLVNDNPYKTGFEWKPILQNEKISIQFKKGNYNINPKDFQVKTNMTQNVGTGQFTKTVSGSLWNSFGFSQDHFINGGGVLSSTTNGTENFAFGLLKELPKDTKTTFAPNEFDFCITQESGNYQVLQGGLDITTTLVPVVSGSVLKIVLAGGSLEFYVGTTSISTVADWKYDTYYFYGLSLGGSQNQTLDNCLVSPSPFNTTTTLGTTMNDVLMEYNVNTLQARQRPSIVSIQLINNTNILLGFSSNLLVSSNTLDYTFLADYPLVESNLPSSISLEIPSLTMESYSGSYGKRVPVLYYIPPFTNDRNDLTFHNSNPLMIDLNNNTPFNINNFHIRLLEDTNSVIDAKECVVVIVID